MKKIVTILSVIAFAVAIFVATVSAIKRAETSVEIPRGTKVENVTRFILADGVLEVVGTRGELLIRAYDKTGKLLYTGKQGRIFSGKARTPISIETIRRKATIDDEVIRIEFKPESGPVGVIEPDPPNIPSGRGLIDPSPPNIPQRWGLQKQEQQGVDVEKVK